LEQEETEKTEGTAVRWLVGFSVPSVRSCSSAIRRFNPSLPGLPSPPEVAHSPFIGMKAKSPEKRQRVELGRHVVADPEICGGQPTFKGTRIMVWNILEQLEDGLTWSEIGREWNGRINDEAIAEAIAIAPMVEKHEPFKGFHVGARRKSARRTATLAA
jgi:uncharacterized protein (DUF433 family)